MSYPDFKFLKMNSDGDFIIDKNYRIANETSYDTKKSYELANSYNELAKKLVGEKVEIISANNKKTMRDGSIGEITEIISGPFSCYRGSNYSHYASYYDSNTIIRDMKIKVKFDNKHKEGIFSINKLKFLSNKDIECVYINKKEDVKVKEKIILKDKFDNEYTEDSFVCFAKSTSRQQGIPLFGRITKIYDKNHFKAQNIKLSEKDSEREYTMRSQTDVIVMNDELMSNIMMARLSL